MMSNSITIEKGLQGQFLEIETEGIVRRFFVPPINDFQGRLQSLIKNHPGLMLVRTGMAVITQSQDLPNPIQGLKELPSGIAKTLTLDFLGNHPFIQQGPANYSAELVSEIMKNASSQTVEEVPEQGQTSVYDYAGKEEVKAANPLTQQLMAQVKGPGPVAVQDKPKNDLQAKFNQQLQTKKETPVTRSEVDVKVVPDKPVILPNAAGKEDSAEELLSETERTLDMLRERNKKLEAEAAPRTLEEAVVTKRKRTQQQPKGKLDILLDEIASLHAKFDDLHDDTPQVSGSDLKLWLDSNIEEHGEEQAYEMLAACVRF